MHLCGSYQSTFLFYVVSFAQSHPTIIHRLYAQKSFKIGQQSSNQLGINVSATFSKNYYLKYDLGCELTGDTVVFGQNAWGDAKNASIMSVLLRLLLMTTFI